MCLVRTLGPELVCNTLFNLNDMSYHQHEDTTVQSKGLFRETLKYLKREMTIRTMVARKEKDPDMSKQSQVMLRHKYLQVMTCLLKPRKRTYLHCKISVLIRSTVVLVLEQS